jgi:hypothetical protein
MDPAHVTRLRMLNGPERMGVADYLSRLSPDLTSDGEIHHTSFPR